MLTNEQKQAAIDALVSPFARVKLRATREGRDFEIVAAVEPVRAMQYRVTVYVDGYIKAEWLKADSPHPETAFMRRSTRKMLSKKDVEDFRAAFGKKKADEAAKRVFVWHYPDFASGNAAINHIIKASSNVELLSVY